MHVRTWQGAYRGLLPDEHLDAMDVAPDGWSLDGARKDDGGRGWTATEVRYRGISENFAGQEPKIVVPPA